MHVSAHTQTHSSATICCYMVDIIININQLCPVTYWPEIVFAGNLLLLLGVLQCVESHLLVHDGCKVAAKLVH